MNRAPRRELTKKESGSLEKKITILTILIAAQLVILSILLIIQVFPQDKHSKPVAESITADDEYIDSDDQGMEGTEIEPVVPVKESGDLPPEISLDRPVRIEILNGCGVPKLAAKFAENLRDEGYDVRDTRNAGRHNYTNSYIYDRTSLPGQSRRLANLLGVPMQRVIVESDAKLVDIDLTLILGSDYQQFNLGSD